MIMKNAQPASNKPPSEPQPVQSDITAVVVIDLQAWKNAEPAPEILNQWYTLIIEKVWISLTAGGTQVKDMNVYLTIEEDPDCEHDYLMDWVLSREDIKPIFRDDEREDIKGHTDRFNQKFLKKLPSAIFIYINDNLAGSDQEIFFTLGSKDNVVANYRLTYTQQSEDPEVAFSTNLQSQLHHIYQQPPKHQSLKVRNKSSPQVVPVPELSEEIAVVDEKQPEPTKDTPEAIVANVIQKKLDGEHTASNFLSFLERAADVYSRVN